MAASPSSTVPARQLLAERLDAHVGKHSGAQHAVFVRSDRQTVSIVGSLGAVYSPLAMISPADAVQSKVGWTANTLPNWS